MTDDSLPLAELMQRAGDDDFLRCVAEAQLLMETDVDGQGVLEVFTRDGLLAEWQNRPLDAMSALVLFDALQVKVRDEGPSATRRSPSHWARARMAPRGGGAVDRADRGRQVLAQDDERPAPPRGG